MKKELDSDLIPRPSLVRAKAVWQGEIVFVCKKCMKKQREGVDGEGTSLQKWLRRAIKREGLAKRVQVVQTSCLDLCPKQGITLLRGRDLANSAKPLRVLRKGVDPKILLDWLADLRDES